MASSAFAEEMVERSTRAHLQRPCPSTPITSDSADKACQAANYIRQQMKKYDDLKRDGSVRGRSHMIARHTFEDEELPNEPMYTPEFEQAKRSWKNILAKLSAKLSTDEHRDPSLTQSLRKLSQQSSKPDLGRPQRVGIYGCSGAGKSSLVGCLIGDKLLTHQTASGESTTNVPLEYRHSESFSAKIVWCEDSQLADTISMHLGPILHANASGIPWEAVEDCDVRLGVTDALQFFQALYADEADFHTAETTKRAISRLYSAGREHNVKETLLRMAKERIRGLKQSQSCIPAQNQKDLWKKLAPFVDPPSTFLEAAPDELTYRSCASALVNKAVIAGPVRRAVRHIRVVDLPGSADTDKEREAKAIRLLPTFDLLIDCGDIIRLGTDDHVRQFLLDNYNTSPSQRLIVAATKCEIVDTEQGRHMNFEKNEKVDLDWLSKKQAEIQSNPNWSERLAFEHKRVQHVQQALFVLERHRRVSKKLRNYFSRIAAGKELTVLCTSSSDYQKRVQGYNRISDEVPLSLSLTGVPTLAMMLAELPCDRIQSAFLKYQNSTLPQLLSDLELQCEPLLGDHSVSFRRKLNLSTEDVRRDLETIFEDFEEQVVDEMVDGIIGKIPEWTARAKMKCAIWGKWHPNIYAAFLSKCGSHRTSKQARTDWNEELLSIAKGDLFEQFEPVKTGILTYFRKIEDYLKSIIVLMKGRIAEDGIDSATRQMNDLVKRIDATQSNLDPIAATFQWEMVTFFDDQKNHATRPLLGYYFTTPMTQIYTNTKAVRYSPEGGIHQERSKRFTDQVCDKNGPYRAIPDGIRAGWNTMKAELINKMVNDIDEEVDKIGRLYRDVRIDHDTGISEDRKNYRNEIVEVVNSCRHDLQKIERLLRASWAACGKQYPGDQEQ